MGAAASVQDLVQALGDEVSKDECRTLSKNLFWTGDVEDWIEDIFDGETISKAKINRKIAKEQEKLHRAQQKEEARVKEINRQKGQRIYADALASEKVAGLSALPANFRDGVVPRDTAEGTQLSQHCSELLSGVTSRHRLNRQFSRKDFDEIEQASQDLSSFFSERISLYMDALQDPAAMQQLVAALDYLRQVYLRDYDSTFQTQVMTADREGYRAFEALSAKYRERYQNKRKCTQSSNNLQTMYGHALEVQPKFNAFFSAIARQTKGRFHAAPTKALFRTVEKIAMRHEKDRRFNTDAILELVRGALVYRTFDGLCKGLETIVDSQDFRVERILDRFHKPTDAGWRDVVINGTLKEDSENMHVVEIQLHYEPFVVVRESLGGHFLYAKKRALQEAVEVVFGDQCGSRLKDEAQARAREEAETRARVDAEAKAKAEAEATAREKMLFRLSTWADFEITTTMTEVDLNSKGIAGRIPSELGQLTQLTNLNVYDNELTGPIPTQIGQLVLLTGLCLDSNHLTGPIPTEIGHLFQLEELYLYRNQLIGPIPTQMGQLVHMTHLQLCDNQLAGPIPTQIGQLGQLKSLYLNDNQLTGPIPTQIGMLVKSEVLGLNQNQLSGPIPTQIGQLVQLEELHLDNNQLAGSIPTQIGQLAQLKYLHLSRNQLTGPIPAQFGQLVRLDLDGNELTGRISTRIGELVQLERLWLHLNQLTGPIPTQMGQLVQLTDMRLYCNQLTGPIPTQIGQLAQLTQLWVHQNQLIDTARFKIFMKQKVSRSNVSI